VRVLVAGGAGFVGSHLIPHLLSRGHEVVVLDNLSTGSVRNLPCETADGKPRVRFIRGDVCRPLACRERFDAIVNLASPASPRDYHTLPIETLEVGSRGTQNLLELAARDGARFLLASTSEVYGDPDVHPQHESYWGRRSRYRLLRREGCQQAARGLE